jgi:hypothetical protein
MLRLINWWLGLSRLGESPGAGPIGLNLRVGSTAPARTDRDLARNGGPVAIPANGISKRLKSRSRAQEARQFRAVDRAIAEIVASRRRT